MVLFPLVFCFVCVEGMRELGSCTFEGKTYSNNEVIDTDPCRPLQCIEGEVPLLIIECVNAPCADYEVQSGDCCATCPNGPNCRLPDGTLMPGDETRTLVDGRDCFCLRSYSFGIRPRNPDAMCINVPIQTPKE
ncbi:hypothetical protein LOTGIDRAFT_174500 [Lottia gigantea]|uniref:VWFC domain-containing protein n=1 Tax=Lottia gigantea TaxID=225164 RepID=V4ATW4_LOTGI|nr:hypothetical protein LOTGIDRAFT_174500 [Lottia gigantea]ESO97216.1 hypothetical protein LOTGIDRAFT_174500 [Lottia gigantea]